MKERNLVNCIVAFIYADDDLYTIYRGRRTADTPFQFPGSSHIARLRVCNVTSL